MKPVLPVVTERYEIRNPSFHAPAIKHKFAECSLQYWLMNQLNSENCFALLTDKVSMDSFYSLKVLIKSRILNSYPGMRLGFVNNSGKLYVAIHSNPIQHHRF